jgi:hypothetical protein
LLQSKTNLLIEDPSLTELYTKLVVNGDFQMAEDSMTNAAEKGLFEEYIRSFEYKLQWTKIEATNAGMFYFYFIVQHIDSFCLPCNYLL